MKSMTGYGKAVSSDEHFEIEIELKSLNHRFLDLRISLPRELNPWEIPVRKWVSDRIKRGKVDVRISFKDKRLPRLSLNERKLQAMWDLYHRAAEVLGCRQEPGLDKVLEEPGIIEQDSAGFDDEAFTQTLEELVGRVLDDHARMAVQEGTAMRESMEKSIKRIALAVQDIEAAFPAYKEEMQKRYSEQITEILKGNLTDEEHRRIIMETGLYIERSDINEELVRLKDHLAKFSGRLTGHAREAGKSLNFILQEMHRESNTIGAKFNSSLVGDAVLILKEEIEKCRELVQNVQ